MLFHPAVEDHRAVVGQHFLDRLVQIGWIVDADAFAAKRLRQFHEIGQAFRPRLRIALAVQQFLPLTHHAEALVVQNKLLDGRAELHRGAHFLHVHQPGRLARHVDHQGIGVGDLHANAGGQAIAHGAQTTRSHPAVRPFKAKELRRPHLMLANLGGDVAVHPQS